MLIPNYVSSELSKVAVWGRLEGRGGGGDDCLNINFLRYCYKWCINPTMTETLKSTRP